MARREVSFAEAVCLALIAESPRHGWALVRELAPDGAVGRVWTLSRALTYRAIDALLEAGMVVHTGEEAGDGPRRQMLAATAAGRRHVRRWMSEPVAHLRDVRTELLVKIVLTERVGGDTRALLTAQRDGVAAIVAAQRAAGAAPEADAVARWRAVSADAVERFLEEELRRGE